MKRAALEAAGQIAGGVAGGQSFGQAAKNLDLAAIGKEAALGAVEGAVTGGIGGLIAKSGKVAKLVSKAKKAVNVAKKKGVAKVKRAKKKGVTTGGAEPKLGASGGDGAGKLFSRKTKAKAEQEARGRCVFCKKKTTKKQGALKGNTDHAIPKSIGGNSSLENAQHTCRTCNLKKGAKTTSEHLKLSGGSK